MLRFHSATKDSPANGGAAEEKAGPSKNPNSALDSSADSDIIAVEGERSPETKGTKGTKGTKEKGRGEKMATVETKTPSGKPVEVRISTYGGMAVLSAKVAGKRFGGQLIAKRGLPGGATHCIGQVCLSAEEAARVAEAVAAYEAADPEIAAAKLRAERDAIIGRIAGAREAAEHAREKAWERADDRGGVSENEYDARAKAAHIDLAAFDAAHPEVAAAIEAEKKAAVERNLWN